MAGQLPGEMRIGEVLQDARRRAGLDMRTAEARTKIRVKYLRALEGEHWDELPSVAYAKGFLRTYAQLLGLDGEALVDEFRRQVEPDRGTTGYPLGDQVLEARRRPNGRTPRSPLWPVLGAVAVAIVALLLVLGLSAGDDEQPDRKRRPGSEQQRDGGREGANRDRARGTVALALSVVEPVEVCLLGGGGEALIDGQVLAAGTEEAYERRRFELRFPKGFSNSQFELRVADRKRLLPRAEGPAAYEIIAPRRVRPAPAPGEACP